MTPQNWVLPLFLSFLIISFLGFLISKYKNNKGVVIISGSSAIIALSLLLGANTLFGEPTGEYKYVAYIKEDIDMTEFHNKYDLISVDDNVFVFKDKLTEEKGDDIK